MIDKSQYTNKSRNLKSPGWELQLRTGMWNLEIDRGQRSNVLVGTNRTRVRLPHSLSSLYRLHSGPAQSAGTRVSSNSSVFRLHSYFVFAALQHTLNCQHIKLNATKISRQTAHSSQHTDVRPSESQAPGPVPTCTCSTTHQQHGARKYRGHVTHHVALCSVSCQSHTQDTGTG